MCALKNHRSEKEEMDKEAADRMLKIVELLAKGADHNRFSANDETLLKQSINDLVQYDQDKFVRAFLAGVRQASDVLSPNVMQKLAVYP
jgi:hypothetical protein